MRIPGELRDWLAREHPVAPEASAGVDPWFARVVGPCRPVITVVAGCPVAHHASGPPFAASCDGGVLVRAGAPGSLDPRPVEALPGWVAVDARPPDVTFTRGDDALRQAIARAHALSARSRRSAPE